VGKKKGPLKKNKLGAKASYNSQETTTPKEGKKIGTLASIGRGSGENGIGGLLEKKKNRKRARAFRLPIWNKGHVRKEESQESLLLGTGGGRNGKITISRGRTNNKIVTKGITKAGKNPWRENPRA